MRQAYSGCATMDRLHSLTRIRSWRGPGYGTGSTPNNQWWFVRTMSPVSPPTTDPLAPKCTATWSRWRGGSGSVRTTSITSRPPFDAIGTVYTL